MDTNGLLCTVVALGTVKHHISGGWRLPGRAMPVMRIEEPSRLQAKRSGGVLGRLRDRDRDADADTDADA